MEGINDSQEVSKGGFEGNMSSEYRGIKIPEDLKSEIRRKLAVLFEEKKVYLDQRLTLAKLSSMIGTNNAYLSSMINYIYECNLPTLINRYRIRDARRLLIEGRYNIKDVYKVCGFVSRSVFYSAFVKETKTTPAKFVKKNNR